MYLSKIEVIGFKSFAQRINLNFDTGVTAIVGPNGCGKTNIVDAIRWALGEQRYSTLRSDKMEDVIFNGTKSRKPLGLAEVSLSIENTKGILPPEYSEVTVTRRVFRSGESEYLLNKVPCRLKDILDLFMDTGMGSDAYSVIELKMVETILSDKTDERRRLFEEAAGVTKYKFRRKAAMRKLESVQQDLMRVSDIVKEVQKTVNSLERQAKRAEQYNEVSSELKRLEVDLLEREYAHLQGKLVPLEERFASAKTDKSSIHETLQSQEERADLLGSSLREIEEQLQLKQREPAAQFETIHRAEERILVANERSNSLGSNIERYEQEKTGLQGQQEHLGAEQTTLHASVEQLRVELAASEQHFLEMKENRQTQGRAVEAKKSEVEAYRVSILGLAHELVEKRGERDRITERIHNLQGRIDRANEENALYETDILNNAERVAQLTAEDRELRRQFVEAERKLMEREKAKKELNDEVDRLQKQSDALRNEIERKASRIDFLRKMVESNEGYSEGTRFLLGSHKWVVKNLTTVADLVHAEERYRVAVEAALGEAAHMLVVRDVKDGYAALEELRRQDKGKATFICLDWVPRVSRRIGRSSRKRRKDAAQCVWAQDVVQIGRAPAPGQGESDLHLPRLGAQGFPAHRPEQPQKEEGRRSMRLGPGCRALRPRLPSSDQFSPPGRGAGGNVRRGRRNRQKLFRGALRDARRAGRFDDGDDPGREQAVRRGGSDRQERADHRARRRDEGNRRPSGAHRGRNQGEERFRRGARGEIVRGGGEEN